ncbi:hypothetical protein ACLB2K_038071 [Fragaria x ananassa]
MFTFTLYQVTSLHLCSHSHYVHIHGRNTIKKEIMKIFEFEKEKTMKLIQMNSSRIAITTDMWTASNQKKRFMAITSHFINDSWNLQSRLLRFVYVPCPHDADTLDRVLMKCLYSWNIHHNLSTLTMDNCTTNDAMIDLLLVTLRSSSLLVGGKLLHVCCCAHLLNLIVKDGLDVIKESIETIRVALEVDRVKKFAYDLVKEYSSCAISHPYDNSSLIESKRLSDNDLRDDDMDAYDAFVSGSSKDTDKSDLERYLGETVLPRVNDKEFDVLYWWKTSGMKYPTLYKVVRDILAILVSTVASESAFSTGGPIVSPHLNRLHSSTLEALMCGRDWLWSELRDAPNTLEDVIDADKESCHDSDIEFTPHQTDDTNTRRGIAARTRSSPLF